MSENDETEAIRSHLSQMIHLSIRNSTPRSPIKNILKPQIGQTSTPRNFSYMKNLDLVAESSSFNRHESMDGASNKPIYVATRRRNGLTKEENINELEQLKIGTDSLMTDQNEVESYKSSYLLNASTDISSVWDGTIGMVENNQVEVVAEIHWNHISSDAISVSSTSSSQTTTSIKPTLCAFIPNKDKPENSINGPTTKVFFDNSNSIHELSTNSQGDEQIGRIVIKGGKWRRTIFELRKNKITEC